MASRKKKSQCILCKSTFLYLYGKGKSKKMATIRKNVDDVSNDVIFHEKPKKSS